MLIEQYTDLVCSLNTLLKFAPLILWTDRNERHIRTSEDTILRMIKCTLNLSRRSYNEDIFLLNKPITPNYAFSDFFRFFSSRSL